MYLLFQSFIFNKTRLWATNKVKDVIEQCPKSQNGSHPSCGLEFYQLNLVNCKSRPHQKLFVLRIQGQKMDDFE
jgi:hypothetical protein